MRLWVGCMLLKLGMAILPTDSREMAKKIMLYHVPGALSETEKAEVRTAKAAWLHS